jgi:hypothetical protein
MNIYDILSSSEHHVHYLKRYFKYICQLLLRVPNPGDKIERHHICPKAIFPEFESLRDNPWNKCLLTPRQHYIAHWLLWKAYGKSQTRAFWKFNHGSKRISSKVYAKLKQDFAITQSLLMKGKPKSPEHAAKLRANFLIYQQDPIKRAKHSEYMKNRIIDDDQKRRIAIGVSKYVSATIWINNGIMNRRILSHESIPEGWKRGRFMTQEYRDKLILNFKGRHRNYSK